jgi:hypothetical protein
MGHYLFAAAPHPGQGLHLRLRSAQQLRCQFPNA